jgi:GR25 family glycosyltransferase involved in LPS biosynthesis
MKLWTLWDAAFVINLDRRADRMRETADELLRCGIHDYERYPAFDHPTSGHEGCSRSHRDLMRMIASGPYDRVLIMEDDIAAVTKSRLKIAGFKEHQSVWKTHCSVMNGDGNAMERITAMTGYIPSNFDVLYLGGGYQEAPISRFNEHVIRCAGMLTTSSMIVTRDFAERFTLKADLVTQGDPEKWIGPIDLFYTGMSRENLFYCLQPRLFFQRKSLSDISGESNSYLYSMTDPTHEAMV